MRTLEGKRDYSQLHSPTGEIDLAQEVYSTERSPNFSYKGVSNHYDSGTRLRDGPYLVTGDIPATLRNELGSALIDFGTGGSDFVLLQRSNYQYPSRPRLHIFIHIRHIRTTVSCSNGLASSMFFKVFSKSFNSWSTTVLVSSALFRA